MRGRLAALLVAVAVGPMLLALAPDADAQAQGLIPPGTHPAHPLNSSPATVREQQRSLADPLLMDRVQRARPDTTTSLPADASPNRWRPERDDPRPGALDYGRPRREQAASRARQEHGAPAQR